MLSFPEQRMRRYIHSVVRWFVVVEALLMVSAQVATSQNQIRGRLRDENNVPVSFAQVLLTPGDRRIVADGNGEFVVGALATGDYELRIKRIGYQPTQMTVRVPSDESWIPIVMQSLPRILDSVRIRERSSILRYTGIVIDDLDQPVVDAEVIAAGAGDLGVRTNAGGQFRLLKPQKGTLILRVRKLGYAPYFGSLTFQAEREDTIRMKRHATDLPAAYIRAESGFGRDSFAYIELKSRMGWKLSSAAVASREDLDQFADLSLCAALMRSPAAGKMRLRESACDTPRCVIIDGLQPLIRSLNSYKASEVEAFEYRAKDWSVTIASREGAWCHRRNLPRDAGGLVLWLRKEGVRTGRER
jgi:hypothetical protein